MGNKLSCSCAPLIRKAYRYEDSPWNNSRRRDGHLLRLWAEVFHVSSSTGAARWQQVSEDLVPVNITCVQDSPECIFHITAYNSQVEKILDVRLVQPGTRLGQASECFVYWKDPTSGDTWGLNFTSPVDAKQFRDCCQLKVKAGKRVPQSTPSSPSKGGREPRCTCAMTIEQMQRAKNGRARYAASVAAGSLPTTLPRSQSREYGRLSNHPSSQSVYDNVSASLRRSTPIPNAVKQTRSDVNLSTIGQRETATLSRTELARAKFAQAASMGAEDAKSVDYGMGMGAILRKASSQDIREGNKSKSTDNVNAASAVTPDAPKKPPTTPSPEDKLKPPKPPPKPEPPPKRGKSSRGAPSGAKASSKEAPSSKSAKPASSSKQGKSSTKKKASGGKKLDVPDRERSPPSDNLLYDNLCYATTPSTSNDNSDVPFLSSDDEVLPEEEEEVKPKEKKRAEGRPFKRGAPSAANSPTSKLLMEYEMHLRNALARGLDAESYSLHTFEALLTQSMENVVALMREVHVELEEVRKEEQALQSHDEPEGSRAFANARSTTSGPKSSTLPLPGSTRQPPHLAARGENTPLLPRASVESTDSRIYLTSSEAGIGKSVARYSTAEGKHSWGLGLFPACPLTFTVLLRRMRRRGIIDVRSEGAPRAFALRLLFPCAV
ncbi:protein still life, isoform SIF type 1 [Nephila pilipes]|uniref:Protein still life, isoform SIF type 1 n=1 Tax=Nephila pilipes TaxID=299642 RepID=A0A8X6PLQ0_NEPPI|nr:protein still life, isoform SIF type 1 [Nephila pilipes]